MRSELEPLIEIAKTLQADDVPAFCASLEELRIVALRRSHASTSARAGSFARCE